MEKAKRKFVGSAIVSVLLAIVLFFGAVYAQVIYQSVWGDIADFKSYQTEFALVKDYVVENIPQGKLLNITAKEDFGYDLYDFETKQSLNCPEEVQAALETIVVDASPETNNRFAYIEHVDGKVSFHIEAVAYAIVYSPDEKPKDVLGDYVKKERCKKITGAWYHVVD